MIKTIEIERFSLTTSKPFDEVVACINAAIGHPDMAEFARSTHEAYSASRRREPNQLLADTMSSPQGPNGCGQTV
jgi:hypothetical protein